MKFKGVIPPMITPFKEDGSIDFEAHAFNVSRWSAAGVGGMLVMGSNSEAIFLDEREKLDLIKITADNTAEDFPVLAGTGLESTAKTIDLTNRAAEKGAVAALILTPHFYKSAMSDGALIAHFTELAEEVDIPVLIYNVPKYTGINISRQVVAELSAHPNIVGMKDSTGNVAQLVQFQAVADADFQILTGTASIWLPALQLGVKAAIMALANCAPEACVELQKLFENNRNAEAEALYRILVPVNHAVTAGYGIPGLKYACMMRGYDAGRIRSPLSELSQNQKSALDKIINRLPTP